MLHEPYPYRRVRTPFELLARRECHLAIRAVLRTLTPRQEYVILHRYGLSGPPEELNQLGRRLCVSKERIRQIQESALHSLRAPARAAVLLPFVRRGHD